MDPYLIVSDTALSGLAEGVNAVLKKHGAHIERFGYVCAGGVAISLREVHNPHDGCHQTYTEYAQALKRSNA